MRDLPRRRMSGRWVTWTLTSLSILHSLGSLTGATERAPEKQARNNGLLNEAYRLERDGRFDAALATYYDLFQSPSAADSRTDSRNSQDQTTRAAAMWRAAQLHQRLRRDTEAKRLLEQLLEERADTIHLAAIWDPFKAVIVAF